MPFPLSKTPIHFIFELSAYIIGFRLLLYHNLKQDTLPLKQRSFILIGAMVGALLGAKLLLVLQYFNIFIENPEQVLTLFLGTGKTVVGALLGGLIGVEVSKKILKINSSTGDVFVYPVMVGIIIGRMGCFLTGLEDETFGLPTNLPWGIDFGDGIYRHPTQLYEILFLIIWMGFLLWRSRYKIQAGELFKFLMIGYLSFRLLVDFIKPYPVVLLGLSGIQIACILGLIYYYQSFPNLLKFQPTQ